MASPVADFYGCTSGGVIAAGRHRLPAWVRSAMVGTWSAVPASNTLSSLDPKNNPAINPVYPASPEWYASGQSRVITAWNSAAVNYAAAEMWVWGGGHADYGGNEPYKLNLLADTPAWQMMRPPSGAIGNLLTTTGTVGESATGLYSDGRPRVTHTYNSLVYVPGKGFTVTNLYYVYPHVNGPGKAYSFSDATNDWSVLSDYTALGGVNSPNGGCCYDSSRNCVWLLGQGAYNMVKLDCATGAATQHGLVNNHAQGPLALKYDAANDLIYILSSSSSGGWLDYPSRMSVFNPATALFHVLPAPTGSLASGMSITGHGVAWDEVGGRLLLWNEQTNRAKISVLTRPVNNLLTTAWVASELTLDAGNSVTPTAAEPNGTYGRFDYIERLGGCVLINAVNQSVYFYRVK